MTSSLRVDEVIEWMECFLRTYPSNSVHQLVKSFKEEIKENDEQHRIHLRGLYEGLQRVRLHNLLKGHTGLLHTKVSVSFQSTEREEKESL